MGLPDDIADLMRRLRRRRRLQQTLVSGVRASAMAAAVLLAGIALADILGTGPEVSGVAVCLAAATAAAGVGAAWIRPANDLALARLVDRRADLKDAVGSALAFASLADPPPFARVSLMRTARIAGQIDARRIIPSRTPRRSLGVAAVLAMSALVWFLVAPAERWRLAHRGGRLRVDRASLNAVAEDAGRLLTDAEEDDHTAVAAAARDLQAVITRIRSGRLALEEALEEIGAIEGRLAEAGDTAWLDSLADALTRTGKALRGPSLTDRVGRHLQHGNAAEAQDALRAAAEEVRQAGRAGNRGRDLSEAAKAFQDAADAARQSAPDLAREFQGAAEDLDSGRHEAAGDRIRRSAENLDELSRRMKQLRLLQRADNQIARLKQSVRAGVPPKGDQRWAALMEEIPESLRRRALPTMGQGAGAPGPSGVGTADTGSGAGGKRTRLEGKRSPAFVRGQAGPDGPAIIRAVRGAAASGPTTVGYAQAFAEYEGQVEAALADETVPLGYRYYVRRYFESIRPEVEESTR